MFRLLFERSPDAIFLLDARREVFVDCNQAAVEMMGATSRHQLLMAHPADLSPDRQPNGRASREQTPELIQLALTKGSHRFEWVARRFDRSEFHVEVLATTIQTGDNPIIATVCRDISCRKYAERQILDLNASLEHRVAARTAELTSANDQLQRAQHDLRERAVQVQKHRDVLLELVRMDKTDFLGGLRTICSRAATNLDVARVSYWSLQDNRSAIVCELLYLLAERSTDERSRGVRLRASDCPPYFEALASRRPIVADRALLDPATRVLADSYLMPLGITSMLDVPVWARGEVVGVLCHEHIGPPRDWSAEEIDFASAAATMISLAVEESTRVRSERLLRESEARFSTAFLASPVLTTISRMSDSCFVEANDAFVRWMGLSREEILGRNSQDLGMWVGAEDRERFINMVQQTGSVRNLVHQFRSGRGTLHTMQLCADIIEISGEPHMLVFGLDITQSKQAEAELLKALAREKELGQLRSKFVSMVSHEFRTPLGIIQSSAEILEDYIERLAPAERHDHLKSITTNTRRMAGLMEEVLLIGSIEAGKMEFKPAPLDWQAFVQSLVDEIASATGHRCPINLSIGDLPCEMAADERLLRHIFSNLLTNAVKYSEAGCAVAFDICCNGHGIVSTVRDRGIGIPPADQEWLFTAFHRGGNVGDRPGTGLGLVIVKRCLELHRGKIKVQSSVAEGTTVTVHLPSLRAATPIEAAWKNL